MPLVLLVQLLTMTIQLEVRQSQLLVVLPIPAVLLTTNYLLI
uniref:Uncharacterized protein n=1 Tax=Rhizophora mucronata TaxID=61149 RepID=A0A2P2P956_RHIMU